ncbi:hypothetical protein CEP52_007401 [Fusarium oligoseptatum]|uniref:Uncharacterized protein n=1 Tax=Fusarium oligoseptatum TaxID=2604345 RepID=A0A428TN38_9HYPO|nr:hypothetical protein CEP52_007401 [Fusarium oligoseptatum]
MTLAISSGKDSANIKPSHKDQERKTHIHIMSDATVPPAMGTWLGEPDGINVIISNAGPTATATPASTSG